MTISKALPLISQGLMKVLERRKNGKYRSEKNRKTVAIADMKDILRNYESEMDTEVEKALIYGLNLAIYNRLSDLTNEEFEEYIASICSLLEHQLSGSFNDENGEIGTDAINYNPGKHFVETGTDAIDYNPGKQFVETGTTADYYKPTERTTHGTRRISSGMIPYREG